MKDMGILYFVVELQPENNWSHKIFYRLLTPIQLKQLYKKYKNSNKNVKIRLTPIPDDSNRFENEINDFLYDGIKQQSFIDKPTLKLKDAIDKDKPTILYTSFTNKEDDDFIWQLTSQPIYFYKQTPYADIPIEDKPFVATVDNVYFNPVSVEGTEYFDRYYLRIGYGFVDIIIDECLKLHVPRKGFEDGFKGSIQLTYKFDKPIDECIHKINFLEEAVKANSIQLNSSPQPLNLTSDMQESLLNQIKETLSLYHDMKIVWQRLHVEAPLNLEEFDEEGKKQLCNVVAHIYRKMPCSLINDNGGKDYSMNLFKVGDYNFLFFAKRQGGKLFTTIDPFTSTGLQCYVDNNGNCIPLISEALRQIPGYLFDNIYYESQLICYRKCFEEDNMLEETIKEDIRLITQLMNSETNNKKRIKVKWFIRELNDIIRNS